MVELYNKYKENAQEIQPEFPAGFPVTEY